MEQATYALYFGNRGFFPGELIADARRELAAAVEKAGCRALMMEESLTRYGAVETIEEGLKYAKFLKANEGKYQGIILCLPNFGDENGAMTALQGQNAPILVLACKDRIGEMDFSSRRDSVCGKAAMCNVLRQCGIRYTILPPFAVDLAEEACVEQLRTFASICRVVSGMRRFNIGAIGARTTAFKTVRIDEIAMQRHGINVETFDLSEIMRRMRSVTPQRIGEKRDAYLEITNYKGFPDEKLQTIARLGAVVDDIISEYNLHAIGIRCWNELQMEYGVAPCLLMCELNERGVQAACEVDICNAVMMRAVGLAGEGRAMLLDINNNYGDQDDKCVLFHCGPVPISMMCGKGDTIEHMMFAKSYGKGSGVGVNRGKIRTGDITFGSLRTEDGQLCAFLGEGVLRDDPLDEAFFGTGTVMEHPRMQEILEHIGREGYRHHLSIGSGKTARAVHEALTVYLGYRVTSF
jgi:L-fucose isomerase-like protein